MEVIVNQQAATTEEATNYKPRWDRAERRIGFSTAKLAKKPKLSDLSNLERLLARLGKEASSLNGIKVAIAARWCSTVYTNLTMQQIESIVTDCRSGENPSKLLADPVTYFDNLTGYKHEKPEGKTVEVIDTGIFANINAA